MEMGLQEVIDETLDGAYYRIQLNARPPEEYEGGPDERLDTAVAAAVTSHDQSVTLLIEVSSDETGKGFVTAKAVDREGEPITPTVIEGLDSVLISAVASN